MPLNFFACKLIRSGYFLLVALCLAPLSVAAERPNILWITSEDNGPHLGCYGDRFATTPNLDRLAQRGLTYRYAWSCAPVCAPARTAIITGMYPQSLGAEHMRSMVSMPKGLQFFTHYLRQAGYYCTNNVKQDYNVSATQQAWDQSSGKAHWRNRRAGQPFFSVFNFNTTHESKIRSRPHHLTHDPARVPLPSYHPDTPEVRLDWAQYYDKLTEMDAQVGKVLEQLEKDGLASETIVFYFADHGPGMPRSKRWPYNSGLHVPLIVSIPERFQAGALPGYRRGDQTNRLVNFVDFAPTVLSLAGVKPPKHLQGHAFLGEYRAPQPPFLFGGRGRMDERYDLVRSVRDERFIYIQNFMPQRIYGQHIEYMFQTPTTVVWKKMFDDGLLTESQSRFWLTKPGEELYDLSADPDEVRNLAYRPEFLQTKRRMAQAIRLNSGRIRDTGMLPEGEMHRRLHGDAPFDMARDRIRFPFERISKAAEMATWNREAYNLEQVAKLLDDEDPAVRYWGTVGIMNRAKKGAAAVQQKLLQALQDPSPSVRIGAAEALAATGDQAVAELSWKQLIQVAQQPDHWPFSALEALGAMDHLLSQSLSGNLTAIQKSLREVPVEFPNAHPRYQKYVARLTRKLLDMR